MSKNVYDLNLSRLTEITEIDDKIKSMYISLVILNESNSVPNWDWVMIKDYFGNLTSDLIRRQRQVMFLIEESRKEAGMTNFCLSANLQAISRNANDYINKSENRYKLIQGL